MSIRAFAIRIKNVYIVDPRDGAFRQWKKPPQWMLWLLYFPGVEAGFIDNSGAFVKARNARLSAFNAGQLEDGTSSSGLLTWDMLKF